MILKNTLTFLEQLEKHNNRVWFHENKKQYETAKKEIENFINELIPEVKKFDNEIDILSAKECMFRIYRDVRFSKNKLPYKTNFGAFIAKGGRKGGNAGYYLHIEPRKSFLGGGVYMPDPDSLKAIRQEIYYNHTEFEKIINNKIFKKNFNILEGEKLKRPPKDFPAGFPDIELLKYKSYVVLHGITDEDVKSANFFKYILIIFKAMYPLNCFLNRALF